MSEKLFDVVFFGILQTGKDKDVVMQNMAKLFKTEPQKLVPYFAGGRKVIKGKINAGTAKKYITALENIGLVVKLEPVESTPGSGQAATSSGSTQKATIDTGNLALAEPGADILEHHAEVQAQKIDDISTFSMAKVGADVLEHPVEAPAAKISDISDISMAEVGSDVLDPDHPRQIVPQKINDISDITVAEPGADIIENPKPEKTPPPPDTSGLSLD